MINSEKKLNVPTTYYLTEFHCKISIKGVEFFPQNINLAEIRENIFNLVPTLELEFDDDGIFIEKFPLEEGDEIYIELSKSDKREIIISNTFELVSYVVGNNDGDKIRVCTIKLVALLKNETLYHPIKTLSYKNKSSVDVLKEVAGRCGLDINSKATSSDNMTWLQVNQSFLDFIKYVLKRSYKSNDSLVAFIDRKSRFNITSLLISSKKNSPIKCYFDPFKAVTNDADEGDRVKLYFNDFDIQDIAGYANKTGAYGISFSVYDLDKVESQTIFSDKIKLSKYNERQKDRIGESAVSLDTFILNTKNVHRNYYLAQVQNELLQKDLFKINLNLYINPSDSVNLMDVLDVTFPSMTEESIINEMISGKYMVIGIVHQISKGGIYRMVLSLSRSGFNKSSFQNTYESEEI